MAKKGFTKVKFVKNYTPRKKGEVKELENKLADFYLQNGIAEVVTKETETDEKSGCADCEKSTQVAQELAKANDALEVANGKVTDLEGQLTTKSDELAKANDALEVAKKSLADAQKQLEAKNKK
jgi:predicted  nucleic acid-binding Zn-ribbon protein